MSAAAFYAVGKVFSDLGAAHLEDPFYSPYDANLVKFGGNTLTRGQVAAQITAHASVGGVLAKLQGGEFGHGFISAGITKGVTGASPGGTFIQRLALSSAVGGTVSKFTGGKFANGAKTAAFQFLFNEFTTAQIKKMSDQAQRRIARKESAYCKGLCHGYDGSYDIEHNFSSGAHVSAATINMLTSEGGGIYGFNGQKFLENGEVVGKYYTFTGSGDGIEYGAGMELVFALGTGAWSGDFNAAAFGVGYFSFSLFWSPWEGMKSSGGEGWIGITFGPSVGATPISASYQETFYVEQ